MITIRLLLFGVAYIALAVTCFLNPTRFWISALETTTFCTVAFSIVACFLIQKTSKPFFIGFAITSFTWIFLHHSFPNREFYSMPATFGEYLAHPTELYHDWNEREDPKYDGISGATWRSGEPNHELRSAIRRRVRFMANTAAAIFFGVVGGIFGQWLAVRAQE